MSPTALPVCRREKRRTWYTRSVPAPARYSLRAAPTPRPQPEGRLPVGRCRTAGCPSSRRPRASRSPGKCSDLPSPHRASRPACGSQICGKRPACWAEPRGEQPRDTTNMPPSFRLPEGSRFPEPPRCAFCDQLGRPIRPEPAEAPELPRLVAGPGLFICERCIQLCREILQEDDVRR